MPLFVQTPRNDAVISKLGTYRKYLNFLDRKQTPVQRLLRRGGLGAYEPAMLATVLAIVQTTPRGNVFWDVGSHIGLYSSMTACIFGAKGLRVTAFEPFKEMSDICRKIRARNEVKFQIVSIALSSRSGKRVLLPDAKSGTNNRLAGRAGLNSTLVGTSGSESESIEVEATTIDWHVATGGLAPTILKIDVGSHVTDVLEGGRATIERVRPWLVAEFPNSTNKKKLRAVATWLGECDYRCFRLSDPLWHPHSVDEFVEDLDVDDRHWLLAPVTVTKTLQGQIAEWRAALEQCDESSIILVNAGEDVPESVKENW